MYVEFRDVRHGRYTSYVDAHPDHAAPVVCPYRVADALPHGSGIDGDWHIHVNRDGSIRVSTSFHAMDEHGGYGGWHPVSFSIRRASGEVFTSGRWAHGKAGDVYMTPVRCVADLADYLSEMIEHELREIAPGLTYNVRLIHAEG